jgi:pyridoxal phosphate enzyme (YggS family)
VTQITDHIAETNERVRIAADEAGRDPVEIALLAVSKRHPETAIRAAYHAGQRDFGENIVQEAAEKVRQLADLAITWHFIGRIQSNKTREIAELFQWVHTVDRLKIAVRLNEQRPHYAPPLNVCIQVNHADEAHKAGVTESAVLDLARKITTLPQLRLRGLMCLPPVAISPERRGLYFARLRSLKESLGNAGVPLDTLSMGMSADLEAAIIEGSTIVRVGTAIFGARMTE